MSKRGKEKQVEATLQTPIVCTNPNDPLFYGVILHTDQARANWDRLAPLEIRPTRYSYDHATQPLGIHEDVWRLFDRIGWTHLMKGCWGTYRDLTLEFLSTLVVKKGKREPTTIKFQLGNIAHELTYDDINAIFKTPRGGLHEDDGKDIFKFWRKITNGEAAFMPRRSKVAKVRNPVFRYVQRVIASSVFARNDNSGMRKSELYVLHCMMTCTNVDLPHYLVGQFMKQSQTSAGAICIGGLITPIAEYLDIRPRSEMVSGSIYIDLAQLSFMRIIRSSAMVDAYFSFVNDDLPDFPLPNTALTTVMDEANWRLDTEAHEVASRVLEEDDEMEHTTGDIPESSSGSHRRRNREDVQEDRFAHFDETLEAIRTDQVAIRTEQQLLRIEHNDRYTSFDSRFTTLENDVRVVRNDSTLMRTDISHMLQMMRDWQVRPGTAYPPP